MRVLVTGGSGFLGRHLIPRLIAAGHDVTLILRPGRVTASRVRAIHMDLVDLTPADLPGSFEAVVHLAARLDDPFGTDRSLAELAGPNVVGTLRLLEAVASVGAVRFVHGSTGGVGRNPPPGGLMREDDEPGPVNPYGLTKHLAEQAVRAFAWPFQRVSLRYFAPYGRGGSNPMFRHHLEAIERGEPIGVGRDGTPDVNPIHVDDAVEATIRALDAPDLPPVINVAGPEVVPMAELVGLLAEAVGRKAILRETAEPLASWAADITRMRACLHVPKIAPGEGFRREFGSGA